MTNSCNYYFIHTKYNKTMNHRLPESRTSKVLTPSQQSWLNGIRSSMMKKIEDELEPFGDPRTELQKAVREDYYLKNIELHYDGALEEAKGMNLPRHQFPDFIQLWVEYRARLGKGNNISIQSVIINQAMN